MTQLIINVEDAALIPSLRKILGSIKGISIAEESKTKKNGLQLALEDAREGRVNHYDSADALFKTLGI